MPQAAQLPAAPGGGARSLSDEISSLRAELDKGRRRAPGEAPSGAVVAVTRGSVAVPPPALPTRRALTGSDFDAPPPSPILPDRAKALLERDKARAEAERLRHMVTVAERERNSLRTKLDAFEQRGSKPDKAGKAASPPDTERREPARPAAGPTKPEAPGRKPVWRSGGVAPAVGACVALCAAVILAWAAGLFAASQHGKAAQVLEERFAELRSRAFASGSVLGCLEGEVGEAVLPGCEAALFASPPALASANAYSAERLAWLAEAVKVREPRPPGLQAAIRQAQSAFEQDRFGVVANMLAEQKGCTAERCEAFALLADPSRVRDNLRDGVFRSTLARHQAPAKTDTAVGSPPTPATAAALSVTPANAETAPSAPVAKPIPPQYSLPSADSIPRVSIMTEEPTRPSMQAAAEPPTERPTPAKPPAAAKAAPKRTRAAAAAPAPAETVPDPSPAAREREDSGN